jgi:allene oxide cyclase
MRGKSQHLPAWGAKARVTLAVALSASAAFLVIGLPRIADAARGSSAQHGFGRHGGPGGQGGRGGHVVHVIEHAVTDTVVHSGGPGDVTGNLLTWHNKVYDPTDTTQVGTDQGSCVRISPADDSWECAWTTFLPKGQITVEGPYYGTKNSVLAITGGTGAYSRARGQMALLSRNGGTEYDFVFDLS